MDTRADMQGQMGVADLPQRGGIDQVLKNVTAQTGITFTPARRPRDVWVAIVEKH